MNLIKKILLKEWFVAFLGATIILATLVTVADLISGFLRGSVTPYQVLLNHLVEYPVYLSQIIPIACLAGSLFSINKLKNRNELTAIFAAGVSRLKVFSTIFQAALLVGVFQFLISAYLGPFVKKHRFDILGEASERFSNLEGQGLKASTIGSGKVWYKSGEYFVSFAQYDRSKNALFDVDYFFLNNEGKLTLFLKTSKLLHLQDNVWEVHDGIYYDNLGELSFPRLARLEKNTIVLNETPEDFIQLESDITTLPIHLLRSYIIQLQRSGLNVGEYMILYLGHIAGALSCLVFAFFAAMGLFNPNRRNSSFAKNLGVVFCFTIFYWLGNSYLTELGRGGVISPHIASFSLLSFFTLIIFLSFLRARTL